VKQVCRACLENQKTPDPFAILIRELAGVNLINYPVRIQLENIGFTDWANLTPESIYFLDASGNPLYFWIEELDTTNQKSIIWVKIPSLPANSQITIYMYYGGSNPYPQYNDPTKVFILFDDFNTLDTTKWTLIGSPTVVDGTLQLTPNNAVMTAQVMPKNIRVRIKEMWARFGAYGPRLGIVIRSNSAINTCYEFANEQGNLNTAVGYYNINRWINGSVTNIGKGSRTSYYNTNVWYKEDCRAYETKLSWLVRDGAETVTAIDSNILVDGYVILRTWDAGNDVRVDWVAIAPYVDPEPAVEQQLVAQPIKPVSDSLVVESEMIAVPQPTQPISDSLVVETGVTTVPQPTRPVSDSLVVEVGVVGVPELSYPVSDSLVVETGVAPPTPTPTPTPTPVTKYEFPWWIIILIILLILIGSVRRSRE
jgi:hypothetical protein